MINAIINCRDKTAVVEFPMDLYQLYQDLHDIGFQGGPHRVKLTDNEEDDIRVKLYSDNDFGNHLILLLKESDTLEDVHTAVGAITIAPDEVKEQLEEEKNAAAKDEDFMRAEILKNQIEKLKGELNG